MTIYAAAYKDHMDMQLLAMALGSKELLAGSARQRQSGEFSGQPDCVIESSPNNSSSPVIHCGLVGSLETTVKQVVAMDCQKARGKAYCLCYAAWLSQD